MIFESWPWRQSLLRDADTLARWGRNNPSDRRAFLIEQKVFNGAYAMRKLCEAKKLSSRFDDSAIKCLRYPCSARVEITHQNEHKFSEHYDFFNDPRSCTISFKRLINMIIHSFTFAEVSDDDGYVQALLITSDRDRSAGLWRIEFSDFVELMRSVGNDSPSTIHAVRDSQSGEWFEWRGHGEPPVHIRERLDALAAAWRRSDR
jgi:hypothetical protein